MHTKIIELRTFLVIKMIGFVQFLDWASKKERFATTYEYDTQIHLDLP